MRLNANYARSFVGRQPQANIAKWTKKRRAKHLKRTTMPHLNIILFLLLENVVYYISLDEWKCKYIS